MVVAIRVVVVSIFGQRKGFALLYLKVLLHYVYSRLLGTLISNMRLEDRAELTTANLVVTDQTAPTSRYSVSLC